MSEIRSDLQTTYQLEPPRSLVHIDRCSLRDHGSESGSLLRSLSSASKMRSEQDVYKIYPRNKSRETGYVA